MSDAEFRVGTGVRFRHTDGNFRLGVVTTAGQWYLAVDATDGKRVFPVRVSRSACTVISQPAVGP